MAFDGIVTKSIVNELKSTLIGLKIDKIYQPEKDTVVLSIRKNKLLISASGNNPRIYFTDLEFENPINAPMFCMVLRKNLSGAKIEDINQFGNDRVLRIDFDSRNDFSENSKKSLIVEIMGKYSNIILLDENDFVIDAIRRVNDNMSRVREILPHVKYKYLPDSKKIEPEELDKEKVLNIIENSSKDDKIFYAIFSSIVGFSKTIGIEISARAGIDSYESVFSLSEEEKLKIADETTNLISEFQNKNYNPSVYFDSDKIFDFHVLNLQNLKFMEKKSFETASKMLDFVYSKKDTLDKLSQKSSAMEKVLKSRLSKLNSKLLNLSRDYAESKKREKYKVYADLLMANLHLIKNGDKNVIVDNFYSENFEKLSIPLDISLSAAQNAQKYYKRYQKLKNAEIEVKKQIDETKAEIDYLESVKSAIELTDEVETLDEIKSELIEQGYFKRNPKKNRKKEKNRAIKEYEFEGFKILVGKNNKENDRLTHKVASKKDIWLHAKNIPGSHVIIITERKEVPDSVLKFAAEIAAYNSKARNFGNISVDYTLKQNVKRHIANKPGLVNYTNYKTLTVDSSINH